jgi:hypothetical protein
MVYTQYVALLRGINVGGGNIIKMTDLKACFDASKLENVATYIQSGNVLFETAETDLVKLVRELEKALSKTFSRYQARIVLCSHAKLRQIVRKAPRGFWKRAAKISLRCDFLKRTTHSPAGNEKCGRKAGCRRSLHWSRCLVFFQTDCTSQPKPFDTDYCPADLPINDDSELEHHQ